MPNYTETINLKKTNMATDGDDFFMFDKDLDENWDKIDDSIKAIINKQNATGIPPSNCYKLKIEKTDISFCAWKNTDGDIVLTTSAVPTASDKIFTQN